jgi:phytoene/squalene synthetase
MSHPVLVALAAAIEPHHLQAQPFLDLIEANVQDQHASQYEDWAALRGYCMLSAAPVGRMVLRLFGIDDPRAVALSDDVCISLQLANFAQDVSVDAQRGRTYLLQCDLREGGEVEAVQAMCERARELLTSGRELEALAPLRLRGQLALYRRGGNAILDSIARAGYRTAAGRPVVARRARLGILVRSIRDATAPPRPRVAKAQARSDG